LRNYLILVFLPTFVFSINKIIKIDNSLYIKKLESDKNTHIGFIAIHNNETDAIKTLISAVEDYGGIGYIFLNISRPSQRIIGVKYNRFYFLYDPNRVFTKDGIIKTLMHYNRHFFYIKNSALKYLSFISSKILNTIEIKKKKYIISLHNNVNKGNFSIKYFISNKYKTLFKRRDEPKNVVLVSQERLFEKFSDLDINLVLLNGKDDDGSLGYFCVKNNIPYINIETRFYDIKRQREILRKILEKIKEDEYDFYYYVLW